MGKNGVHDLGLFAKIISINLIGTLQVLALAAEHIAKTEADENGQRGVVINAPGILLKPMLMTVSEEFRDGLATGVPFPKRLGDPSEYAQLALSIIANDYLNGDVIRLDGALRMAPC
ncbi:hypothetical protein [Streptomyces brasiliensis]|uniref:Uncharacterized protein n=1 Tax=Streptomyces brasiliensis TaxID=1954 RepID=A0A917PAU4_9ACTN|nr:hypothetical protein [Streptomyces brasiliensis]GGJ68966.1 hypothetical protein GCM10010121_094640 [Streptomyces brasiliensis]